MTLLPVVEADCVHPSPSLPPPATPDASTTPKTPMAPTDEQTRAPTTAPTCNLESKQNVQVGLQAPVVALPPLPPPPPPTDLNGAAPATTTPTKEDEVRRTLKDVGDVAAKTTTPPDAAPAERCELEGFMPFAKCHLWKLMMSFYDREGVESWAQGIVPHFITSNTFIAKRYSNVLRAYFRDATRPGAAQPVRPGSISV